MTTSSVTSKGQITLPAYLRRELQIKPSDRVVFGREGARVYVEKVDSVDALFGSLANPKTKPLSNLKMKEMVKRVCLGKMILLDTNYLLRFFTNDVKSQAVEAKKLITSSNGIYIPVVVFAEVVYFLRNYYKKDKSEVCDRLLSLLTQPNIKSEDFVSLALNIYKKESVGFYDCLLIAKVITIKGELKTFDLKLQKVYKKYSE